MNDRKTINAIETAVKKIAEAMKDIVEVIAKRAKEKAMEYNNLKILDSIWYGKLGIIKAKDKITNETKIYIGEGEGLDVQTDIYRIVSFGTKHTPESFNQLIDWLEASNAQNQEQS